jgi:hypothetical protein
MRFLVFIICFFKRGNLYRYTSVTCATPRIPHVPIEIRNAVSISTPEPMDSHVGPSDVSDGFVRGFKQAIQAVLQVRARLLGLLGLPIG